MSDIMILTLYGNMEVEDYWEVDNIQGISCILDNLNSSNKVFTITNLKNEIDKNKEVEYVYF
ncbi:hypothetical protein [Clostridium frigidicarnis]|uniref:Uncharacterized protein n=1 Tax=Clostridium frigidicarnis TaxID=84698 RepID=A0A1I0YVI6_9CLOT|nr:hypothetical protein [Clostridium frigidicarnis]SFB17409.1 hypothetical protein SAMN04488528_101575 [Clostridium frigidicarnis]